MASRAGRRVSVSGKSAKASRRSQKNDWRSLDRFMLCEDIDWIGSMAGAASKSSVAAPLGLANLPYFARVTHEGLDLARRQRPVDAARFEMANAKVVAAARHSTKLLDDTHKNFASITAEFDGIRADHQSHFGPLMSIFTVDGWLIGSSRTTSYQTNWTIDKATEGPREQNPHYVASFEMGRKLAEISLLFGHEPRTQELGTDFASADFKMEDVDTADFAAAHLGDALPVSVADVLIMVEAAVNTALVVLEPASTRFRNPVFRARFVAASHALSAIQRVLAEWETSVRPGPALSAVVTSADAASLLGMRALRNRAMHYGIPSALNNLGPRLDGYGLVEATTDGLDFQRVDGLTVSLLQRISEAFGISSSR